MKEFSPDIHHEYLLKNQGMALAFDENKDYDTWKQQVKEKLTELLGKMPEKKVPLNIRVEWECEYPTYIERRFVFDTEPDTTVPCHLLIPKNTPKPCPVVICLQGHTTGMHISLGRKKFAIDNQYVGNRDAEFALQAVAEGYAALVMDQRGFGERVSPASIGDHLQYRTTCQQPAMVALLLGRTMLGERVWDISRAIDALGEFEEIDVERLACMGNSGGGTATYYAACMDERIKIAMPSCSVCDFSQSIGIMQHCVCNFLPNMANYFDMGDLACLIAPRKIVDVMGMTDVGFLIEGSLSAYDKIEKIYAKAGCPDNCKRVIGKDGHRFYADPSWKVFRELSGWN